MASDIAIAAEEILKTRSSLNKLYVHHCQQELAQVEAVMDRDTWFSAQEALDFGVIDDMLRKREDEPVEEDHGGEGSP